MTCRCTVPPHGPTDSMIGARDCPEHPTLRSFTVTEVVEIAEQELPRWRGTLERLAQWEQQHEPVERPTIGPELPTAGAMRWTPGLPIYRPSDFDTRPYEPRRVVA